MAKLTRNFLSGRMNKVYDQRIIPQGEYIDAMNIRMGSTENSEVGVIENTKGNLALTALTYIDGTPTSTDAVCIGSIADSANETIYWFVHDSNFTASTTGKLDMIVSFDVLTGILTYHIVSTDDGNGVNTTLNFNPKYLITGVNLIENLLFFTDDYNAPRVVNVRPVGNRYPNPIAYIDQFDPKSILVIKQPPIESPTITPILTSGQENYIDTRFICFAYRYRYEDGEHSATSQWSAPAFIPNPFEFSPSSYLNEGMVNLYNAVEVTYNTGGPLVKEIDLLFKQSANNVIKVIEKLNKKDLGIPDNATPTYLFNNSKIFTVLSEAELLRLYDNVPRFAKAQTIMGNRLMYGNYVEGYDLIDKSDSPIKLEYTTSLVSTPIGQTILDTFLSIGYYSCDTLPHSQANSVVTIDLQGANLVEGSILTLDLTFEHGSFTGAGPTELTAPISITLSFFFANGYLSPYALSISVPFTERVGTDTNILSAYPGGNSCGGVTFTDTFTCVLPDTLDALFKYRFGIDNIFTPLNQPIRISSSPLNSNISLQLPAMQYIDALPVPSVVAWEYYEITYAQATFQEIGNPKSLHSNRGYEIGIVYMDEFNRASTALVSPNNTEFVACGDSDTQNQIFVTIPPAQVAPAWATRYKFVIKPDQENYETIYCNLFFQDPNTNLSYFLLEGENARKVEKGDRLIVKADTNGATPNCVYATVLDKESKIAAFVTPTTGTLVPGGVYMKIDTNNFAAVEDPNATIVPGTIQTDENTPGDFVLQYYPMNQESTTTPGEYFDYAVPAGSIVKLSIKFQRLGPRKGTSACERRIYTLNKQYIVSANYSNMYNWWIGDNIGSTVNSGIVDIGGGGYMNNIFISTLASCDTCIPYALDTNYYQFYRYAPVGGGDGRLVLMLRGTERCPGYPNAQRRRSSVITSMTVQLANNLLVFETQPQDALPDVFFENELSFEIDQATGDHYGNVQNQNIAGGVSAIINTGFFNCFAFGNGVESYKVRDSILGKPFDLGNRVTTVSAQDYKEANRFADMTYSGVYNTESNLNKLNEFNLGLLNYKYLEVSFGSIYAMDGRETDVLVLQEDKISYVLAGKNLLSDSAAGSAITSVPEVLGTQIARTEKYGISFNPESYVQWGYDRFFTDAKRGAVVQLKGNAYSNEQLSIISEEGMRTWFRDEFNASFNSQKLGGFDPYMNEYVLVMSDRGLPNNPSCVACGTSQVLTLSTLAEPEKTFEYCVNVGVNVGETIITWNVISIEPGAEFNVAVTFNGTTTNSGLVDYSDSMTFEKDVNYVEIADIAITYTGDVVLDIIVNCPTPEFMRVYEIVLSKNSDAGDMIHVEYRYTNGPFVGPLQSSLVTFVSGTSNPLVSRYNTVTGFTGTGSFPPAGSTMRLQTNKTGTDTKNFDPLKDKFRYYRSTTAYANTSVDLNTLLSLSSIATPISGGPLVYHADFTVPPVTSGENLYLIWDMREATPIELCYNVDNIVASCCDCLPCYCFTLALIASPIYVNYVKCNGAPDTIYLDATTQICARSVEPIEGVTITQGLECVDNACPVPTYRCTILYSPSSESSFTLNPAIEKNFFQTNRFTLANFVFDGVEYASGQELLVQSIYGGVGDPILYGVGLDGTTYPMNVSDWMNSIGVPGIVFRDNLSVIELFDSASTFTIRILKSWDDPPAVPPVGSGAPYYLTSDYGLSVTGGNASLSYGYKSCAAI